MRIDLNSSAAAQVSGEQDAKQVVASKTAKASYAADVDRATLTSNSATVHTLVSAVLKSPEVRQDKVDSLRQAVSDGQYQLDSAKTAASIIDEYA